MKKLLVLLALFSMSAFGKTVLLGSNTLVFRGEVNSKSVSSMIYKISKSNLKEITLFISSPGGSVLHGSNLIDFMKGSGKKFTCVTDFAASMAFSIFQHCDIRYVLPSGILMQHQSSWGVRGKDRENKQFIKLIDGMNDKNDISTAIQMKMPVKVYRSITAHDLWLFGRFTKNYMGFKLSDDIVTARCTRKLLKSRVKETIRSMFSSVDIIWSGCPLIEAPVKVNGDEYISTKSTWNTQYIKKINGWSKHE